jgi:hypothetical protein
MAMKAEMETMLVKIAQVLGSKTAAILGEGLPDGRRSVNGYDVALVADLADSCIAWQARNKERELKAAQGPFGEALDEVIDSIRHEMKSVGSYGYKRDAEDVLFELVNAAEDSREVAKAEFMRTSQDSEEG